MRIALSFLALAGSAFAFTDAAVAQNYPWCAQYTGNMGGVMNCGFVSFQQCMATVQGMGGFCIINNRYVPPAGASAPKHGRSKHKESHPS